MSETPSIREDSPQMPPASTGAPKQTKIAPLKERSITDTLIFVARQIHAIGTETFNLRKLGKMLFSIADQNSLEKSRGHSVEAVASTESIDQAGLDSQSPIIIEVHGFGGNSGHWVYHKKYQDEKYPADQWRKNVFTINLGSPFQSIEEYSATLRQKILEIKERTGRSDVILVGHSMGGLVCETYTTLFAKTDGITIHDLITIGSPLSGTWMALLAAVFCRAARQMLPVSAFTTRRAMEYVEENPPDAKIPDEKVTKRITRSYIKDGERVWEQIFKTAEGHEFIQRRTWKKDGSIQETPLFQVEIERSSGTRTESVEISPSFLEEEVAAPPQSQEGTIKRAKHFGSKYDIVVSGKSAMAAKNRSGIPEEKSKDLEVSGHLGELTHPKAHEALARRIQKSVKDFRPKGT